MSVARRIQANRRIVRDGVSPAQVDEAKRRLAAVFAAFPGIQPSASDVRDEVGGAVVTCRFAPGPHGRAAALAVGFVAGRVGAKAEEAEADALRVRLPETPFVRFVNFLNYASELQVRTRPAGELARPQLRTLPPLRTRSPLPTLLGRALGMFDRAYKEARAEQGGIPPLASWANVLRVIDSNDGTEQRELARRAVLSKRVAEVVVKRLVRRGDLTLEKRSREDRRGTAKIVRLTAQGRAARASGADRVDTVEDYWRQRFGADSVAGLRAALANVVARIPVELPHRVTGYGAGDPSVTGGDYVAEQPGPPRIPAHGQDWPVVLRPSGRPAADLPLPALLAQALAAFAIDYERERIGQLRAVSTFLRFVDDDGMALGRAGALGGVSGNGKTLHERHLDVVVEPGRASDKERRVYLTPKGRRMRDAYPHLVVEIESRWQDEYGAAVTRMRDALAAMDRDFDRDLPDYPDPTAWIHRLWFD